MKLLPLAILTCLCSFKALSQVSESDNTSLIGLLTNLQQKHEITFSYSPRLLKGLMLSKPGNGQSLDQTLAFISAELPLTFEKVGDKGILILPVRTDLQFKVQDAQDGTTIELVYVIVNQSKQRHLIAQNENFILEDAFKTDSL